MAVSSIRVLVMIAAHNEEENITHVVRELLETTSSPRKASVRSDGSARKNTSARGGAVPCRGMTSVPETIQVDYLVINDGSTDRTEEICRDNGFHYVSLPVNLGIGGAIQTGYRYAEDHGYDIAVQLDGDGQHDPRYLSDVIRPIMEEKADYVIGSRFIPENVPENRTGNMPENVPEGQKDNSPENDGSVQEPRETDRGFQSTGARRTGIRFLSRLIRLMCGKKIYDVTSGFRAVGRRSIGAFAASYPIDYPEPEAIIDAVLRGERVLEVPVRMREREHGTSSINVKRSVYYMIKVSLDIIVCRISYGLRRDPSLRRRRGTD